MGKSVNTTLTGEETSLHPQVLVTGFTPFDGRQKNSSWVAAQALRSTCLPPRFSFMELPVIWGEPDNLLRKFLNTSQPQIILAMGEGKEGYFAIETVARNHRKHRQDNLGHFPPVAIISEDGPDYHLTNAPVESIQRRLSCDFPVELSTDAGNFLCEETLYTLGELHGEGAGPDMSLFVHLPPYGTHFGDSKTQCNDEVLAQFSHQLMDTVLAVYGEKLPHEIPEQANLIGLLQ
jgi:pyrrolidone-carboxylate peptidase